MNTAIIVAAGSGQRFKSEIPKQFLEINGKTVLEWTMERFQNAISVDAIVLVLARDQIADFGTRAKAFTKLSSIVSGGTSRAGSVMNGLEAVAADCEIVAVHDGARPLVSVDEIERTIEPARMSGASCLVAAVTDTIKSIRGREIADTLDRGKLRRALTPQAFRKDLLERAFQMAGPDAAEATDECYLVEKLGHPIAIVEGRATNIKITHPEDLILAELMLKDELTAYS